MTEAKQNLHPSKKQSEYFFRRMFLPLFTTCDSLIFSLVQQHRV